MPKRKNVLKDFRYDQPFIGFTTKFRTVPKPGKGAIRTHNLNYGGSCREELVWDTREFLQGKTVTWKTQRGSWHKTPVLGTGLDIDHQSLKQPGVTYLWMNDAEDDYYGGETAICRRSCCVNRFPELVDAIVGPVAVLLNDDRYTGDWWKTFPGEAAPKGKHELRWYGTDNFFLRHPVLTSLMLGMFRQSVLLFTQSFDEPILRAVKREEVEDCLTNADPVLAARILTRLRPWIEVPNRHMAENFAFPKGYWHRLGQIHRAVYKHGYKALFNTDLLQSWNIGEEQEPNNTGGFQDRYAISNGPKMYWGTTGAKVTADGKRLAKLGK